MEQVGTRTGGKQGSKVTRTRLRRLDGRLKVSFLQLAVQTGVRLVQLVNCDGHVLTTTEVRGTGRKHAC